MSDVKYLATYLVQINVRLMALREVTPQQRTDKQWIELQTLAREHDRVVIAMRHKNAGHDEPLLTIKTNARGK